MSLVLDAEVRRRRTTPWPEPPGEDAFRRDPLGRLLDRRARAARPRAGRSSSRPARGSTGSPAACQPSAEALRARVVVGEPLDVVVERVDAGRGDDPRLPHRAAEQVLLPRHAFAHRLARAGEERAERAAEPLRETERDGVESAADTPQPARRCATAAFISRAPSRWTASPSSRAAVVDGRELVERPDPPAARCCASARATTMLAGWTIVASSGRQRGSARA